MRYTVIGYILKTSCTIGTEHQSTTDSSIILPRHTLTKCSSRISEIVYTTLYLINFTVANQMVTWESWNL